MIRQQVERAKRAKDGPRNEGGGGDGGGDGGAEGGAEEEFIFFIPSAPPEHAAPLSADALEKQRAARERSSPRGGAVDTPQTGGITGPPRARVGRA